MKSATIAPIKAKKWVSSSEFFAKLKWLDGKPLVIERYRRRIFDNFLDGREPSGRLRFNLALCGRAKKNAKSLDAVLAAIFALLANDSPGGNQCYLLASDEGQAGDDLSLAKKLVGVNPSIRNRVKIQKKMILRTDGKGFLEILPAHDVAGAHGKTYRFCAFDEIHTQRDWSLLEAMQLDPTRPDSQQWICSYASIHHKPGVPLFDMYQKGITFADARMFFSWYAGDFTNDNLFVDLEPEARANPSMATFADGYLEQQKARLPAYVFRRLHLNLPGLPAGSAYTAESVMDAIARGVVVRAPVEGVNYLAAVDMSGGSNDDAVLSIAHTDADGRGVLDYVGSQGPPPPFAPVAAIDRFVTMLRDYGVSRVTGDRYAGETFRQEFLNRGVKYEIAPLPASKNYEQFEPLLNGKRVILLDVPTLEQQLLGLGWRGQKIDHGPGEHDDFANAAVLVLNMAAGKVAKSAVVVSSFTLSHAPSITGGEFREGYSTSSRVGLLGVEHPHERVEYFDMQMRDYDLLKHLSICPATGCGNVAHDRHDLVKRLDDRERDRRARERRHPEGASR